LWFSERYIIFTARNVNVDRERRNIYFPICVAVIIQRWIYDWLPTVHVHARKILSSSICLSESMTVPSCPVLVWQQLLRASYEHSKICAWPVLSLTVGTHALALFLSAHFRPLNIDDYNPKFGIVILLYVKFNFLFHSVKIEIFPAVLNFATFRKVPISLHVMSECYIFQSYVKKKYNSSYFITFGFGFQIRLFRYETAQYLFSAW